MVLTLLEDIQALWDKVYPYLTGITLGGIVSCLFYAFFSGSIKKFINKIQIGDMVEKTVDKTMDRIKTITITTELQPLVAEELNKIETSVEKGNEKTFENLETKMNGLIECVGILASFFENSISIPQEVKDKMKEAIDNAKSIGYKPIKEEIIVKPLIEDSPKQKKHNSTNVR